MKTIPLTKSRFLFLLLLPLCCSGQYREMFFERQGDADTLHLNLINAMYGPAEVNFISREEFRERIKVKEYVVIGARDTVERAISIPKKLIKDSSAIKLTDFVTFESILGRPNAKHNNYEYALPYPKGQKYRVSQGFNGKFTHNSTRSRYAIDFNLDIGDTICAARGGIVVRIRHQFKEQGGQSFIDKANLITILHDDGTLAAYVHLQHKGALVVPGETVKKGQPIGISGNTGYTRGPHLHFVVREADDKSVPVYFEGQKGEKLKKGKKYLRK